MTARIQEAGVFIPLDLAGALARCLDAAKAERRRRGDSWPSEIDALRVLCNTLANVQRTGAVLAGSASTGEPGSARNRDEQGGHASISGAAPKCEMNVTEIADAACVSESFVRRQMRADRLPAVRTPEGWRASGRDVRRWLAARDRAEKERSGT